MTLWRKAVPDTQCEESVPGTGPQYLLHYGTRCRRKASYVANGKAYCWQHAPPLDRTNDRLMETDPNTHAAPGVNR